MSDADLVSHAQKFIHEKRIKSRGALQNLDSGLYTILIKRKLLDEIKFEQVTRKWSSFSDADIVSHVKKFVVKNNIKTKSGLEAADNGMYVILRKRKLLDQFKFDEQRRDWSSFSDSNLILYAQKFVDDNQITNQSSLKDMDSGLCAILRTRNLLHQVKFEQKRRSWSSFSNEELIAHAKKFIEERGIESRYGLVKADLGLYHVLRDRELLDAVFRELETSRQTNAIRAVVRALDEF